MELHDVKAMLKDLREQDKVNLIIPHLGRVTLDWSDISAKYGCIVFPNQKGGKRAGKFTRYIPASAITEMQIYREEDQ